MRLQSPACLTVRWAARALSLINRPIITKRLQFPDRDYIADPDDRQYRRAVYMHWQRTFLHPMLANFDAPSRRTASRSARNANSPQQALTLLNDPTFVEAARVWAAKLLAMATG